MAEAALLAYVPERDVVRAALNRAGFQTVSFFQRDATRAFVAGHTAFLVVAFRGTVVEEPATLRADARAMLAAWEGRRRVHAGFKAALDVVWTELRECLETAHRGQPLWFTGHSLGAALATLAADRYPRGQGLYTFGSPRVGNAAFAAGFRMPAHRFANNNDLVARLPPPIGYRHVGTLHYLDRDGRLVRAPGRWAETRDRIAGGLDRLSDVLPLLVSRGLDVVPFDELIDHSPLYYAIHLWNNYVGQ